MNRYWKHTSTLLLAALLLPVVLLLAACSTSSDESYSIILVGDGNQQTLVLNRDATVAEVLERADITLGDRDRVNPPTFTQLEEGMTVTVVRVMEEVIIERDTLPFSETITRNDGLPFGETRLLQQGVNGEVEITYRVVTEDDREVSRNEIRRVTITPPQDQVVMVGSAGDLPSVTINGKLVYISGGNAWIMQQNSANKRPLTTEGGLDERIFSLSQDGKRLLFSRQSNFEPPSTSSVSSSSTALPGDGSSADDTADADSSDTQEQQNGESGLNELWAMLDVTDPASQPLKLDVEDVLWAQWLPGEERTFLYSTAEPRNSFPGWQANNDLWQARISANGVVVRNQRVLAPSSGGIYGWFGTTYAVHPEGELLAWAQPSALGTLLPIEPETSSSGSSGSGRNEGPPDTFARRNLAEFAPPNAYDFVWVPAISWSPDGELLATTVHGPPLGDELPEDSPLYDLWILSADGSYQVNVKKQTGMWTMPQFSSLQSSEDDNQVQGWLAFLQAIEPLNSVVGRYQLMVADRDGSNQQVLFPSSEQTGLLPQIVAWSPDARQISFVERGNLLVIDVASGHTQQITSDGLSSSPRWAP